MIIFRTNASSSSGIGHLARCRRLAIFLKKNGIGYGIHYPLPLPLTQAYLKKSTDYELEYPNSSQRVGKIISLPIYPELTNKELNYIINTLKNYNK